MNEEEMVTLESIVIQKNQAYWERNQLVAALSKLYPAWLSQHCDCDDWEEDWRWIVFIEIPCKEVDLDNPASGYMVTSIRQLSWHIHDSELEFFAHLQERPNIFDGHDTETKYRRLRNISIGKR